MSSNALTDLTKNINTKIVSCRLYKGFYPNLSPKISSVQPSTTKKNVYTVINISGENFFPYGTTKVNFGNYKNIEVVFFSSFNISFSIPYGVASGNYQLVVINNFNTPNIQSIYSSDLVNFTVL